MKAIDRVMKAYLSTRKLSAAQTDVARTQFTKLIDQWTSDKSTEVPSGEG